MEENLQIPQLSDEDKQKAYEILRNFQKNSRYYLQRKNIDDLYNYLNNCYESFFKENKIDIPIRIVKETELISIKDRLNDLKGMILVIPFGSTTRETYLYTSDIEELVFFNEVDFKKLGIPYSAFIASLVSHLGKKIGVPPALDKKGDPNLLGYRFKKSDAIEFDTLYTKEQEIIKFFIEQNLDIKNQIKGHEEVVIKLKVLRKAFETESVPSCVIERIVGKCKTIDKSIDYILNTSFYNLKKILHKNEERGLSEASWRTFKLVLNSSFNYIEFKEVADFLGIVPKNNLSFVQQGLSEIIKEKLTPEISVISEPSKELSSEILKVKPKSIQNIEDKLKELMVEFCRRFNLKFHELPFSYSLTEQELNAANLIGSGDIKKIMDECKNNYSEIDKKVSSRIRGLSGTGMIEADAVSRAKEIIDKVQSKKEGDRIINYLRYNQTLFSLLVKTYDKIKDKNLKLEETIPIPKSEGFFRSTRAKISSGFRLGMMIHECIHYILAKNGISYSVKEKDMRDEGLCTFLHKRFGKNFIGDKEYEKWAKFFEIYFKETPDSEIISLLKKISPEDLLKMMNDYLSDGALTSPITEEKLLEGTKILCKDCGADITGTNWAAGGFCEECLRKEAYNSGREI